MKERLESWFLGGLIAIAVYMQASTWWDARQTRVFIEQIRDAVVAPTRDDKGRG